MIKLLKELKWSPDGCAVETISPGEYQVGILPPRAVAIALELGFLEDSESSDIQPPLGTIVATDSPVVTDPVVVTDSPVVTDPVVVTETEVKKVKK